MVIRKWPSFGSALGGDAWCFNCHNYGIPSALVEFLGDKRITFVGKEVATDATTLLQDYGLLVANVRDVSRMAANKYEDPVYLRFGLSKLVFNILNVGMEKPREITMSEWDREVLSEKQIQYMQPLMGLFRLSWVLYG